ncbi:hypothetical protein WMY93_033490 [Mugilogobius chulae]|uniref:Myb/SANT-like DNA-binding domain-containing protein n=1 Tax=Mugilogobius chulae TaxID=88201 RepID=A0AAW0MNI5_9GOBI
MAAGGKKRSYFWSDEETEFCISTMKELNIITHLDGKKQRNVDLFKTVVDKMTEAGFPVRTVEQVRSRWKILKKQYYQAKQQNNKSGSCPTNFRFFKIIDDLLGHRPLASTADDGVDVGFESSSLAQDWNESAQPSTEQTTTTENPTPPVEPSQSKTQSRKKSQKHSTTRQQQDFLLTFQQRQQEWMERQLEQSYEREQRLLTEVVEQSNRSLQTVVNQLISGLRAPNALYHHGGYHSRENESDNYFFEL